MEITCDSCKWTCVIEYCSISYFIHGMYGWNCVADITHICAASSLCIILKELFTIGQIVFRLLVMIGPIQLHFFPLQFWPILKH